jgi:CAAX protease family protein
MSGISTPPPGEPPPEVAPAIAAAETERRERAAPTWGPGRVAVGILALLLTTGVEATVVVGFDPDLETLAGKLVLQAALAATLVGIAFIVAGGPAGGPAQARALGLRRPGAPFLGLAALTYVTYVAVAIVYSALVNPHQEDITRDLGVDETAIAAVVAGLLIVVAAPVSEEIFFRGFIFGGLRTRLPFWVAGPLSAAIFGIFHFTGSDSWAVIPVLAFLGFGLAFVYERTGSLYPTMLIHAVNNAIAFALLTS